MRAVCQRLSRAASSAFKRHDIQTPEPRLSAAILQCQRRFYMSPTRLVSTAAEGIKRRKLNTVSAQRGVSPPTMAPALIQRIRLTPVESTLRQLLLDVAKYIDENPTLPETESHVKLPDELAKQPITLRFTGGWVRDKLLGVQSHDIDVAINKMTGYQYGLKLKEYLEIPGKPEKYGLEGVATSDKQSQKAGATNKSKTVGGLHKIEANPEKSKHLETVTTKILGLDIDLVNLRKETYTDESRTPQIEFGSPEEDALRRDATVNAMFYNINTEEIEDFTGRGHDDMGEKIIRTPLEAYQTFKDDPLRVLRLIRFASRLGYSIDREVLLAMRNPDIKDALRRKISRERVGVELDKALRGPDPYEALRLVFELDLYETIFCDPTIETSAHYRPDTEGWQTTMDTLRDVLDEKRTLSEILAREAEERYMAWQLSALVPYRDAPQPESTVPGRKPPPPFAVTVAREGIKATNKVSDIILAAIRNRQDISGVVDRLNEQKSRPDKTGGGEDAAARDWLGMAVRRWGASWRSQAMYAFLVDIVEHPGSVDATERKYTAFLKHLRDLDILDAYSLKPLLDGKALAKALNIRPGPWMKDALDIVMAWQLRNPGVTTPDHAIEAVKAKRGELTSALVRHFLELTIRPLFVKSRPATVTDMGRKVTTTTLPSKMTAETMDDSINKPWKAGKDASGLDLLKWVVAALDVKLVDDVWPMVVPPILTLIDDWETTYKRAGAELLQQLLATTPPVLLERTGLGEVFEQALMSCLTYLPTITPQDESIELLSAVYPALLSLAKVRYPLPPPPDMKCSVAELGRQRVKFLDTVIRKGIIYGYSYCNQYPRITALLFDNLVPLLNELGIESVKHLKYILPMLTEVLSHPLGNAQPATLSGAAKAVQAVILNCWPRIPQHRGEVLKGVTLCWLNLDSQDREGINYVRADLQSAVKILRMALKDETLFDADCGALIATDGRLEELLTC